MYVLINRSKLQILARHQSADALSFLAWIECGDALACICLANEPLDFDRFTHLELLLLAKNATGVGFGGYAKDVLLQCVFELTTRMQEMTHSVADLKAQADAIPEGDNDVYKFVPGGRKPMKPIDLYEPVPLHVDRNVPAEQQALATALVRTTPAPAPFVQPAAPVSAPKAPRAAQAPPSAPGAGSVTQRIYATADQLWKQAGEPSDASALKALRKNIIIPALVKDGVNENSAGKGSLMWQKARFNI